MENDAHGNAADYLDVLLLCAAPLDVRPALKLAVEIANFEAEVRRSPIPICLTRVFPPTFEQLQRELSPPALQRRVPRVFHFKGHGDEDYLWFEDAEGCGDKVTAPRLRRLFAGTPIRLVLLNACWSASPRVKYLCAQLVEGVGYCDIPSTADTGEINLPLPLSQPDGGHAVCLVGYELR